MDSNSANSNVQVSVSTPLILPRPAESKIPFTHDHRIKVIRIIMGLISVFGGVENCAPFAQGVGTAPFRCYTWRDHGSFPTPLTDDLIQSRYDCMVNKATWFFLSIYFGVAAATPFLPKMCFSPKNSPSRITQATDYFALMMRMGGAGLTTYLAVEDYKSDLSLATQDEFTKFGRVWWNNREDATHINWIIYGLGIMTLAELATWAVSYGCRCREDRQNS